MDNMGRRLEGARLVARAWIDAAFKSRLLTDAGAAAAELGISASVYPTTPAAQQTAAAHAVAGGNTSNVGSDDDAVAKCGGSGSVAARSGTILTAVENTPTVHNVVVCTLCRCVACVCMRAFAVQRYQW
jgi:nitrile hydratase